MHLLRTIPAQKHLCSISLGTYAIFFSTASSLFTPLYKYYLRLIRNRASTSSLVALIEKDVKAFGEPPNPRNENRVLPLRTPMFLIGFLPFFELELNT